MKVINKDPKRIVPENGWSVIGVYEDYTAYQKGGMCALSSVVQVSDEHLPLHWEWLVSFSIEGRKRLSNQQINKCLKDFKATHFEEDNHEKGIARKFWYAVEEEYRIPCPCKDEKVIVEGDYQYSVKKEKDDE